jgi:hypothetical protein
MRCGRGRNGTPVDFLLQEKERERERGRGGIMAGREGDPPPRGTLRGFYLFCCERRKSWNPICATICLQLRCFAVTRVIFLTRGAGWLLPDKSGILSILPNNALSHFPYLSPRRRRRTTDFLPVSPRMLSLYNPASSLCGLSLSLSLSLNEVACGD